MMMSSMGERREREMKLNSMTCYESEKRKKIKKKYSQAFIEKKWENASGKIANKELIK